MTFKTFITNIKQDTINNQHYRKVIDTGSKLQLVLMSLAPSQEIGTEVHPQTDQFFRIEQGIALAVVNGVSYRLGRNDVLVVHAGFQHNIINRSRTRPLKFYTIYAPPNHSAQCVQRDALSPHC